MKAYLYWNSDRDICVVRFTPSGATFKQFPTDAINHALEVFYNQSEVTDPYLYNIWSDPETLWGLVVTETMELTDEQAFAMAQSIVDQNDVNPPLPPYDSRTYDW